MANQVSLHDRLKPIETAYRGCRFRSRLEARWAVYFDALGIKWQYEPEGFVLPDGTPYLPDFWLDDFSKWAEVKPTAFDAIALRKARFLRAIMLVGAPQNKAYPSCDGTFTHMLCLSGQRYSDIDRAVIKARSARFEFGEEG